MDAAQGIADAVAAPDGAAVMRFGSSDHGHERMADTLLGNEADDLCACGVTADRCYNLGVIEGRCF